MKPEIAKQKLLDTLNQKLEFNRDFDRYFSNLKDSMQEELIKWCIDCKEGNAKGSVPKDFKDLFVFFRKIGNSIRCTLIKKQNSDFIEIHLTEHREYDDLRTKLGYKRSSYYGS
jgi:hypothetical protein